MSVSTFVQHPYKESGIAIEGEASTPLDFRVDMLLEAIDDPDPNIRWTARLAFNMFVPRISDEICPRCNHPRPSEDFYIKRKANARGEMVEYRRILCKYCDNELRRMRYHENKLRRVFRHDPAVAS